MNLRTEWTPDTTIDFESEFYSREDTVSSVVENFDLRRYHSSEGYDLTINGVTDKCLVQTSSNPFMEYDDLRKIHCPLSMTFNRGDYVEYENCIWLINDNVVNVDGAYWSTRMNRCSFPLRWQNEYGNIIERYMYSINASAYNNGIRGNSTITIGTDQLMLWVPFDNETKKVKRNKKFMIDNNREDPMVYKLTRPDRTTFISNGFGCICWLVTECAYNPSEDDLKYGICDYFSPTVTPVQPPVESHVSCSISGRTDLYVGKSRTYTAEFQDENGNVIDDCEFVWSVSSPFADKIIKTENGKSIEFLVNDSSLAGSSFLLQVVCGDAVIGEVKIIIRDLF